MVEEYHTGANVLLAYWHYCNRGSQPFTVGSSATGFHAMAQLSSYQTRLVNDTSLYIQANGMATFRTPSTPLSDF